MRRLSGCDPLLCISLFQIDMTSSELRGEVSEAGKNRRQIVCVRCQSKILPPGLGTFQEIECQLDCFQKGREGEKETLREFFRVDDMFDFDNLGFTNTVENKKFLSCADCDLGPLGYHDLTTRLREDLHEKLFQINYFQQFLFFSFY